MTPDSQPHDDLPELPDDAADLQEILAPLETGDTGSGPGPAPGAPPVPREALERSPRSRPPLRALDRAPRHLRLAALIVVVGSLLPWLPGGTSGDTGLDAAMTPGRALLTLLAKGIVIGAAWLWFQQVLHNFGPKLGGALGRLAELQLRPKKVGESADPRSRVAKSRSGAPTTLEHPFPTGLHALSLVVVLVGMLAAAADPRQGLIGSNGMAEVAMLGWAAFTWVHIGSYERWGGFNPLFPLLFLGMLFAGAAAVLGAVTSGAGDMTRFCALLGGAAVAVGGGLATYTIVEAMMQAKKQGDRKKQESLAARRAARKPRE